jgi:hypothetical protein
VGFYVPVRTYQAPGQAGEAAGHHLAQLLDELIQQYLRGQNIWLTVAHQSIEQIDDQLRQTLLSLGTYLFGRSATMPEARILADVLYKRDPLRVKHFHKVWGKVDPPTFAPGSARYFERSFDSFKSQSKSQSPDFPYYVLDTEPGEYMSLEEQQEEAARRIAELRLFEFLCRPAIREGEISHSVIPVSIANLDFDDETGEYQFPNYDRVARFRAALEAQSGIPAATILKELASCLPATRGTRVSTPSPKARASQPETPESQPALGQQAPTASAPERQARRVTRQVRLS